MQYTNLEVFEFSQKIQNLLDACGSGSGSASAPKPKTDAHARAKHKAEVDAKITTAAPATGSASASVSVSASTTSDLLDPNSLDDKKLKKYVTGLLTKDPIQLLFSQVQYQASRETAGRPSPS